MEYINKLINKKPFKINNDNFMVLFDSTKYNDPYFKLFKDKLKTDASLTELSILSIVFDNKYIVDAIKALSQNEAFKKLTITFHSQRQLKYLNVLSELKNVKISFEIISDRILKHQNVLLTFLKKYPIYKIYIDYNKLSKLTIQLIENNCMQKLSFINELTIDETLYNSLIMNTSIQKLDFSCVVGCIKNRNFIDLLSQNKMFVKK